jgi:hypothetical protein
LELVDALVLKARLNQEVGYFPVADRALAEVREVLEAGGLED